MFSFLKKDNRRRLNGRVFCNMSVGEELTITSATVILTLSGDNDLSQG